MRYRIGSELVLKVEDNFGYSDKTYRAVKVQVIAHNVDCDGPEAEYLVYVPPYEYLTGTFVLSKHHASWYDVDKRFIGDTVKFIAARHPLYKHIPAADGERCNRCGEFFEGVDSDAAGAFVCRACRENPWR